MRHISRSRVTLALLLVLVALGCAKDYRVDLRYDPIMIPDQTCVGSVAVVKFSDARKDLYVGEDGGTQYFPNGDVSSWLSGALRDQLSSAGCQVEFHDREYDFATDSTITGQVEEAYVRRLSTTNYETVFRIKFEVHRKGLKNFNKTYGSRYENTLLLPSSDNMAKLLEEGLQDMMRTIMPELLAQMRS